MADERSPGDGSARWCLQSSGTPASSMMPGGPEFLFDFNKRTSLVRLWAKGSEGKPHAGRHCGGRRSRKGQKRKTSKSSGEVALLGRCDPDQKRSGQCKRRKLRRIE